MSAVIIPPMPLPETPDTGVRARYWTRDEYHRAADSGVFGPEERLELIRGEIVTKMPQKSLHAAGIRLASDALVSLFGRSHDVRPQLPLALSEDSEPEPDVLVAVGAARDYVDHHPTPAEVVLVVEISDTTLATDRGSKGALYAQTGSPNTG